MIEIKINSIDEMKKLGNLIGNNLKGGETICLTGDLGAGKTHLTQFIGEGMEIDDYITSPTFAILNIYEGRKNLNHFDTYRLEGDIDFDSLGFDDYLFSDDVNIVEWPEKVREILPKDTLEIEIKKDEGEKRILKLSTKAIEKYKDLLEKIENEYIGN